MAIHTHLNDKGAMLTTDHAASSYGLPVLVLDNGNGEAYGPGDLPLGTILEIDELFCDQILPSEEFRDEVVAARTAGFLIAPTSMD